MTFSQKQQDAQYRTLPVVAALLAGILATLIVLMLVLVLRNPPPPTPPQPNASGTIAEGQTESRKQAQEQGLNPPAPSRSVNTDRLRESYRPHKTYLAATRVSLRSRGSAKDWGVRTDMNMHYQGEMQTVRQIESNDGQTIQMTLEFKRACNVSLYTQVEGVHFDLDLAGGLLVTGIDLAGSYFRLRPGWTQVSMRTLETIANSSAVRDSLSKVATDVTAKAFARVCSLEGKKVHLTYANGEGVTSIRPIDCEITKDEKSMIYAMSLASDAYILPDKGLKEDQTWAIDGRDMLPVIDPSLKATLEGEITVRRGQNTGTADAPTAVISIDQGVLQLQNQDERSATMAKWAPRGQMTFSFKDKIVTNATLTGAISVEHHSTDHIIFETRHTASPEYKVSYTCEILP